MAMRPLSACLHRNTMKKTIDETVSLTVIGTHQLPDIGTVCFFHVPIGSASDLFHSGDVWENQDGREFVIRSFDVGTNCWNNPEDQVGVVFDVVDGGLPPCREDILHPSTWKYGIKPSRTEVESRLNFVETLFIELGATPTDLNRDRQLKFNERKIYRYKDGYYSVDVVGFDEKPFIVIEFTNNDEYAANGALEDVEPFPYDLPDEKIVQEVKFAFEIEPYPDTYPDY